MDGFVVDLTVFKQITKVENMLKIFNSNIFNASNAFNEFQRDMKNTPCPSEIVWLSISFLNNDKKSEQNK